MSLQSSAENRGQSRGETFEFLTASTRHNFSAFHSRFSLQAKRKAGLHVLFLNKLTFASDGVRLARSLI